MTRREKIMQGVDVWTAFYRANPHRFVHDYLPVHLDFFQQILNIFIRIALARLIKDNIFAKLASGLAERNMDIKAKLFLIFNVFPDDAVYLIRGMNLILRQ